MTHGYPGFAFRVLGEHGARARTGILSTPHGDIPTPAFVFCATHGSIKGVAGHELAALGTTVILGNTYHLMLRPTAPVLGAMGGLARFANWHGPTFTDSGGFQIFSLGHRQAPGALHEVKGGRHSTLSPKPMVKVGEDHVVFRSYVDGALVELSPERAMAVQADIGADIVFVLDECTAVHHDRAYTAQAMRRTHRWARRCLEEFQRRGGMGSAGRQALYGIVQGGVYADLRHESADFVNGMPFFGQAIGGTLGPNHASLMGVLSACATRLRRDRPTHLLGIGAPGQIVEGVRQGCDTFDCVSPTRAGRHGWALVSAVRSPMGRINLRNRRFAQDTDVVDPECDCPCCTGGYALGYLHHLFKARELLGPQLLSLHNIRFMTRFMERLRRALQTGDGDDFIARQVAPTMGLPL